MDDVFLLLRKRYPDLSQSGKRIADHIFNNAENVQGMPIAQLARNCNVATASVTRFCRALDFENYHSFKQALTRSLTLRTASNPKQDDTPLRYGKIAPEDDFGIVTQKTFTSYISCLTETMGRVDPERILDSARRLKAARRVYCFGQGGSFDVARSIWTSFISIAPHFYCIEDTHMQVSAAASCTQEDVVIFVSFSGATRPTANILKIAHERGAHVILITYFTQSESIAYADTVHFCGTRDGYYQYGSIGAKVGMTFLIDILHAAYCQMLPEEVETNMHHSHQATLDVFL